MNGGPGFSKGEGNSREGDKRKYLICKGSPARGIHLSGEKVICGNRSLPGTDPLSNVNFPYKSVTFLFSKILHCLQFLKIIN